MAKWIMGLSAILIYGAFGVASATGESLHPSASRDVDVPRTAGAEEVIAPGAEATTLNGEMSEEEKERRRRVCDKIFDACNDQCKRFYDNPRFRSKLRPCRVRCSEDDVECRKEIPN